MKKRILLFTAIALTATTTISAQVKKGDKLLGASMGIYYNNTSGPYNSGGSSSNANIAPRIGFGLGQNSVIGFRTHFGYSTSKTDESDAKNTSTSLGGSLYWRKFMPIKGQIGWYVEPNAGITYSSTVNKSTAQGKIKTSSTNYGVGVVPGIFYQPLTKLLISADFGGLSFNHGESTGQNDQKYKSSHVNLSLMNSFTFGVDFILGKS